MLSHSQTHPPVALTVAGSDCSAGAGVQADLKAFKSYGVYGLTAVTCVVAEVPGRVAAIQPVEAGIVRQQIELCLEAFPVAAMKTGLLYSREIIEQVADVYQALPASKRPPLIIDPVMVASSGDPLLRRDALAGYPERLFPLAALVTPNLDEARVLLGGAPLGDAEAMRRAGRELRARYGVPFLMKGGHLGGDQALDVLVYPDGRTVDFAADFTRGFATHGTGCTYSAAVAAGLATGLTLENAIHRAKAYISGVIENGYRWEHGGRRTDALGQ